MSLPFALRRATTSLAWDDLSVGQGGCAESDNGRARQDAKGGGIETSSGNDDGKGGEANLTRVGSIQRGLAKREPREKGSI